MAYLKSGKRELKDLSVEEAANYALEEGVGNFLTLIKMKNAEENLQFEEKEIISEFYLYILEKKARPVYLFKEKNNASFKTYITVVFRNWLFRRLSSLSVRQMNKQISFVISDTSLDERKNPEEEITNILMESMFLENLNHCIESLSKDSKNIVRLILEGNKIREIVKKIGIPRTRLYNTYYAILSSLRKCLESKGISREMVLENE